MKKIFIMLSVGVGVFLILVVIIFFVLSKLDVSTPVTVAKEPENPNRRSVSSLLLEQRDKELDSLKNQTTNWKNEIFLRDVAVDSLNQVIALQKNTITGYEKKVNGLNRQLQASQKQQVNIKELAKTFETMKVNEIGPILNKVDNATVIAIYKNMGSRSKKMIMTALSNDRAAEITKLLAGTQKEG